MNSYNNQQDVIHVVKLVNSLSDPGCDFHALLKPMKSLQRKYKRYATSPKLLLASVNICVSIIKFQSDEQLALEVEGDTYDYLEKAMCRFMTVKQEGTPIYIKAYLQCLDVILGTISRIFVTRGTLKDLTFLNNIYQTYQEKVLIAPAYEIFARVLPEIIAAQEKINHSDIQVVDEGVDQLNHAYLALKEEPKSPVINLLLQKIATLRQECVQPL